MRSDIQLSASWRKARICRDYPSCTYLENIQHPQETEGRNLFLFFPTWTKLSQQACADGQRNVCISLVWGGGGRPEPGPGTECTSTSTRPYQGLSSAESCLGPQRIRASSDPEAASDGGEVHALPAVRHSHPAGSRAQGGARQMGPGGTKLLLVLASWFSSQFWEDYVITAAALLISSFFFVSSGVLWLWLWWDSLPPVCLSDGQVSVCISVYTCLTVLPGCQLHSDRLKTHRMWLCHCWHSLCSSWVQLPVFEPAGEFISQIPLTGVVNRQLSFKIKAVFPGVFSNCGLQF